MGDRHSLSELRASSLFTPHHNSLTENQCGHHHGRITSSGAIVCLEPSKRTGGAVTVEPVRLGRSFMIPPFNLLAEPCRIWSLHVYWWRWVVTADIWGPPTLHISAVSIIEHEADDCSIPRCLCVSGAALWWWWVRWVGQVGQSKFLRPFETGLGPAGLVKSATTAY